MRIAENAEYRFGMIPRFTRWNSSVFRKATSKDYATSPIITLAFYLHERKLGTTHSAFLLYEVCDPCIGPCHKRVHCD